MIRHFKKHSFIFLKQFLFFFKLDEFIKKEVIPKQRRALNLVISFNSSYNTSW